jgi:hypothetical protein
VLIERCRMSTTVLDVLRALPPMHLGTQKPPGEDREASRINARVFQSVMQTKKRNYR